MVRPRADARGQRAVDSRVCARNRSRSSQRGVLQSALRHRRAAGGRGVDQSRAHSPVLGVGGSLMPTNGNVLCQCGRFMRVKQNSVTVEELTEDGSPYKLFDADLYECVECGHEIITGFGRWPIAEHF